jgi:aryl-alcohol dehydrogenase-like predicted oxidoreductase
LKLALGTAQFGLSYGISNQNGQVSREAAKAIVSLARLSGIHTVDTAIAYGESEACLGQIGVEGFKVITKLPAIPDDVVDVIEWVHNQITSSLQRLNLRSVYAVLLHNPQQLLGPKDKALIKAIGQLKAEGMVQKVGVSIYSPSELDSLMNVCPIDLVQAPFNLIDQRLQSSGWLQKLYYSGVEVHTRSTFLQGLLLMPVTAIPKKFKPWKPVFNAWHNWLLENSISATQACIGFVQAHKQIENFVVGVENVQQLEELIRGTKEASGAVWPNINCHDEHLINPSNWNVL